MAKIDLTSKEWCDLVFEGRNKSYGAYDLRMTSSKRHNVAMLIILIVAVVGFSLPSLIRIMTPEKVEDFTVTEVTQLSDLPKAEVKKTEELKPMAPTTPPPPLKSSIKFTAPVIKDDSEVSDEEDIKSQDELAANSKIAISIADVKGNDEINGQDIADFKEKIKYPIPAQEAGIQGRVVVRFVVSKTGEIKDVTVLRSVESSLDKEAVRVIQMMPKWIPGKQNGNNVAVYFTVPVVFKLMQ